MDNFLQMVIGDIQVLPEVLVAVKLGILGGFLEFLASLISTLGKVGR